MNCTFRVAKTKALISFAVTAKLICAFDFANAECWFSHEAAHLTHYLISGKLFANSFMLIKSSTQVTNQIKIYVLVILFLFVFL